MIPVLSSKRNQPVERASVDVIRCGVADGIYCLEMSAVTSVQPTGEIRALRRVRSNDPVGLIEYLGRDVPVFDLLDLLNVRHQRTDTGSLVVLVEHPIQRYAFRVESVSRAIRLAQENVLPLPRPMDHVGGWFRGIVDFTRERQKPKENFGSQVLPGVSEPKQAPINYRRSKHQMQLLLSPKTLLPGHEAKPDPAISFELLLKRYASVAGIGRVENARQIVVFPAGVLGNRQLLIGLSISQVVEISEPLTVVAIPGARPLLQGFVHWRNCPVPMLNLQTALGHQENSGPVTHLLILRDHHGGLVALPVAGRVQSLRLPLDHRPCALPNKNSRPYVLGAFELEERLLILPRLDALSGLATK
jgi:chemotaxis signal transduction protein